MALPFQPLEEEVQKPSRSSAHPSTSNNKKSPLEKMRVRMAAETYNVLNSKSPTTSDDEAYEPHGARRAQDSRCGQTEKQLSIVIAVAIAVIVILSILLVVQHYQLIQAQHENEQPQLCLSDKCVAVAGDMLSKMDLSTKPCDNFYQYACGKAINDPLTPPDKAKWNVFSSLYRRNEAILKRVLDEPGTEFKGKNSTAIWKAKAFYAACMNTTATENTNTDVLKKHIKQAGSWPVTSDEVAGTWDKENWQLEKALVYVHSMGQGGLFDFGIGVDDKNSNVSKLEFVQSGLSLGDYSSYLTNSTKMKKAFIDFFVEIVELLGGKDGVAQAAEDVWNFEYRLAQTFVRPEELTDPWKMYHPMTVGDLQSVMKNVINLEDYLEGMFGEKIPDSEPVLVPTIDYFGKMADLVKETSQETLSSYLVWNLLQSMVPYMPTPFHLASQKLRNTMFGTTQSELWVRCVGRTSAVLGFALGTLYVQKEFAEDSKATVETILDDIQQTFEDSLPDLDWMDDKTRKNAFDKAEAVIRKIAYPDYIMNPEELDQHYENLTVVENEPFENIIRARSAALQKTLDKRGKPPDRTIWSMVPATVNAYYSALNNEIVFPAGILQSPFFDPAFPMAVNYGGIGSIIGHELTHGFDSTGSNYDKYGNLHNWWTNKSKAEFQKRTECLVKQYSQFTVGKAHLNGLTTLGENIADNGGLKTAYKAYQGWLSRNGGIDPQASLPGLNMTTDQLFFLGFSQIWCAHYTPEYALKSLVTDSHSYAKYRVIGSLGNFPKFSEVYKCHAGSAMNPENKCSVW